MDHFPIFLNLQGERALIIGGGSLAARKAALIAKGGAKIIVIATSFSAAMQALARDFEQVQLIQRPFSADHLIGTALVLAATDDESLNQQVYDLCKARGIPVNVADQPKLCSYILPAIVDRSPVVVAVSTGGRSPVLARYVKALLERALPQQLGQLAVLLKKWRAPVAQAIPDAEARRRFWQKAVDDAADSLWRGSGDEAEHSIERNLNQGQVTSAVGQVALIGAPIDDPELLSIKAHRLIQQAEWVFYDEKTPNALLELARREAHCVNTAHNSEADNHNMMLTKLERGQSLVRLYGEDSDLLHLANKDKLNFEQTGITPLCIAAPKNELTFTHSDQRLAHQTFAALS